MEAINDFNRIWSNIEKIVISKVRENLKRGFVDINDVNHVYQQQIKKWQHSSLQEHVWFTDLKSKNEALALQLYNKAVSFQLQKSRDVISSPLPYYAASLIVAIVVYFLISYWGDVSLLKNILFAVVALVVMCSILLPISASQQDKSKDRIAEEYRAQMKKFQGELEAICSSFD